MLLLLRLRWLRLQEMLSVITVPELQLRTLLGSLWRLCRRHRIRLRRLLRHLLLLLLLLILLPLFVLALYLRPLVFLLACVLARLLHTLLSVSLSLLLHLLSVLPLLFFLLPETLQNLILRELLLLAPLLCRVYRLQSIVSHRRRWRAR